MNKTLFSLLKLKDIPDLARPSNIRYGNAIYKRGGVEFITQQPDYAEAWVGGLDGSVSEGDSQRRRTKLFIAGDDLKWHCAESAKKDQIFCKHCVALTLAVLEHK